MTGKETIEDLEFAYREAEEMGKMGKMRGYLETTLGAIRKAVKNETFLDETSSLSEDTPVLLTPVGFGVEVFIRRKP